MSLIKTVNLWKKSRIPCQMKGELVTPLKDFVKEFSQMVSYKNYTKKLFRVAEGQLLYNIEIKKKFFPCISKEGVKKTKPLLGKIKKGTVGKMFNIKCKAFLKYVEFLGGETGKACAAQHNALFQKIHRGGGS